MQEFYIEIIQMHSIHIGRHIRVSYRSWSGVAVAVCVHCVAASRYPGLCSVQFLLSVEGCKTDILQHMSGAQLLADLASCTPTVGGILVIGVHQTLLPPLSLYPPRQSLCSAGWAGCWQVEGSCRIWPGGQAGSRG